MIRSLTILTFLAAASHLHADIAIRDFRATYGSNGPERPLPVCYLGETIHFRYVIDDMAVDDKGRLNGEIVVRLLNQQGQPVHSPAPSPLKGIRPLGGKEATGTATVAFLSNYQPGEYIFELEIRDLITKRSAKVDRKLTVKKPDFAILNLEFFLDPNRTTRAARTFVTGQLMAFLFEVEGHDLSAKKVDMTMTIQTLDEKGTELMLTPLQAPLKIDDPARVAKAQVLTFNGSLNLNRVGQFKLRIDVQDHVNNKKIGVEVPFRVVD